MNAGLSNLITLKRNLLGEKLSTSNQFDREITLLGLGVAAMFDRVCNRRLVYASPQVDLCEGNRDSWIVNAYPVVSFTSVEMRDEASQSYETQAGQPLAWDPETGIVRFGGVFGSRFSTLRLTYVGGYWFDDTETEEGTLPTGAARLPSDLQMAFIDQAAAIWRNRDRTGTGILQKAKDDAPTGTAPVLLPHVAEVLRNYTRFAMI